MNKKYHAFFYRGYDANGNRVAATIYANHILIAKQMLCAQGIWIKKIYRKLFAPPLYISAQDLLMFTKQLSLLVNAALPLVFCLSTLSTQLKPMMGVLIQQMIMNIKQGQHLSEALKAYADLFPYYFISLIEVGEKSGQLGIVLSQLCTYQEKILSRKQQLKKALLYPVCVSVFGMLITVALLLLIVPQFQLLFQDAAALPFATRMVFSLADFFQSIHIQHCVLLFLFLVLIYLLQKHSQGISIMQKLLHYLPGAHLLHMHHQMHYLYSFSVALKSGLPLQNALLLSENVVQHTRFAKHIAALPKHVQSGMNLAHSLTQTRQFDEIVIQLVIIGEQTSQLPILLAHSAHLLEQRMESSLHTLLSLLGPILIVLLGLVLGGLIIALYLPIFQLGTLY